MARKAAKKKAPAKKAPAVSSPPNGYARILENEFKELIDLKLFQGVIPKEVAAWLQDEKGQFKDVMPDTLEKQLLRYRAKYIYSKIEHTLERLDKGVGKESVGGKQLTSAMRLRLSVLERMEELAEVQHTRLFKMYDKEKAMPMVTDTVTKLMPDYLKTLQSIANLQLETGHLRRAPKVITGQIDVRNPEADRPQLDIEFDKYNQRLDAGADLVQLAGEVIDGEYRVLASESRAAADEAADDAADE